MSVQNYAVITYPRKEGATAKRIRFTRFVDALTFFSTIENSVRATEGGTVRKVDAAKKKWAHIVIGNTEGEVADIVITDENRTDERSVAKWK